MSIYEHVSEHIAQAAMLSLKESVIDAGGWIHVDTWDDGDWDIYPCLRGQASTVLYDLDPPYEPEGEEGWYLDFKNGIVSIVASHYIYKDENDEDPELDMSVLTVPSEWVRISALPSFEGDK